MSGLSDYGAEFLLNWATGVYGAGARYLALFTAPPSDAGSGGTEVSAGGYARVQVAGVLTAGGSWTSGTTIPLASAAPAWLLALGGGAGAGVNVYDTTTGQPVGTVLSISGTTVTLTAAAAHASSGASDSLAFSAFPAASPSSGSEPATLPANVANAAALALPQATANWGTVEFWGLFDASTGGDYLWGDYLGSVPGGNPWLPFSCSDASPGVLTTDAAADVPANGSAIVVTAKDGGTLPPTSGSWAGVLTTANASANTFTAGVNTTGVGGGLFRQVTQQSIPVNVTFSFAASTFTLKAA